MAIAVQASIAVAGLITKAVWVNQLIVELFSDAATTQLVSTGTSTMTWDGEHNVQNKMISFFHLKYGQTYYVRAGISAPLTGYVTWSNTFSVLAGGSDVAPDSVLYTTASVHLTPSGVNLTMSPSFVPPNIDHFDAYWSYNGSVPDSGTVPKWQHSPAALLTISMLLRTGETATCYIRAVLTSQIPQAWVNIGSYNSGTIDDSSDGTTYGRTNLGALYNGFVDPRKSGVIKLGSINPAWTGQLQFAFNSSSDGTAWVTWTWTQLTVLFVDGTNGTIPANPGGYTVSGLLASTTYYFYPWTDAYNIGLVGFVGGGTGTDGVAQTSKNANYDRSQSLQNHVPLSAGAIPITTPVAPPTGQPPNGGGGGGGGSGGGGQQGCPRFGQKVEEKSKGIISVEQLVVGDSVLGENGTWLKVRCLFHQRDTEFLRFTTHRGEVIEHSTHTEMKLIDGSTKKSFEIASQDLIVTRKGAGRIVKTELIEEEAWKVVMEIDNPHFFWCGTHAPDILAHNIMLGK